MLVCIRQWVFGNKSLRGTLWSSSGVERFAVEVRDIGMGSARPMGVWHPQLNIILYLCIPTHSGRVGVLPCCHRPGLGWKPGWCLRNRSRSHDGDRKPRPKPKPVASILRFRKPKPNPVASEIIIWKAKPKPVASRPEKWEATATGFGLRSRNRSQTRSLS